MDSIGKQVKHQNMYIAKESLTFPFFVVVMFGLFLYASICTPKFLCIFGTVFFGLGVAMYAYKYIRYGRTTLIIDNEGITIKDWSKTTTYCWGEVASVYTSWRMTLPLVQQWLTIKTSGDGQQYWFHDICLSNLYCREKSVRKAIEEYAWHPVFDYTARHENNRYVARICVAAIVAVIAIFICLTCLEN